VRALREKISFPRILSSGKSEPAAGRGILQASGWSEVPAFRRSHLPYAFFFKGPAVIEDSGCTIYVPSDFSLEVEAKVGCLRMKKIS
jgi:N-methylhydantoinase A/oxoprolinase/acetone carboxylase beta subunit